MIRGLIRGAAVVAARASRLAELAAAATLSRSVLRQGVTATWNDFNPHRDEVLSGLMAWERTAYGMALKPGDRILLIGCGSGRDLIALAEDGYTVVGVDPAPEALRRALFYCAERGVHAPLVEGFFEDHAFDGPFDSIIFSFRSYSLILGRAVRIAALDKARRLLSPGGRVVISYAAGPGTRASGLAVMRAVGWLTRTDVRPEPGDHFYRIAQSPHFGFEHHFAPGELEAEAVAAGCVLLAEPGRGSAIFVDASTASSSHPPMTVANAATSGAP